MALRGQRATSLKSMQCLAEPMTYTMMDETIDQSKRTKFKVIGYQVSRYEACGSRAKNIEMPPDWNKCGPYVIKNIGETSATIENRRDNIIKKIVFPPGVKPFLDLPHSVVRCKLRAHGTYFVKNLHNIMKPIEPVQNLPDKRLASTLDVATEPSNNRRRATSKRKAPLCGQQVDVSRLACSRSQGLHGPSEQEAAPMSSSILSFLTQSRTIKKDH